MKPLRLVPICLSLVLAACSLAPPKQQLITVYYDFPTVTGAEASVPASPLRSLDVVPSPWLAGNAMYYRLAYADVNRREHFAGSRWSGQPAELLSVRLQRKLMSGSVGAAPACRLRIDLDDFVQVFDSTQSSKLILEGRATLYGAQQKVLARRSLAFSQPAGPDARSGVAAAGALADRLASELQAWTQQSCIAPS